jgi:hypothetical protein
MTDAAIIQATFAEWRMVKGRKVLQIICEVPLEAQGQVFAALGAPMPDTDSWVAIARLRAPQAAPTPELDHKPEPPANDDTDKPPRPLSQVSAILCNIVAFRRFIHEAKGFEVIPTVDEAATWVRETCGVKSRSEFDTDENAAANFRRIRGEYDAWMRAA